jgi:hypothetical protein
MKFIITQEQIKFLLEVLLQLPAKHSLASIDMLRYQLVPYIEKTAEQAPEPETNSMVEE